MNDRAPVRLNGDQNGQIAELFRDEVAGRRRETGDGIVRAVFPHGDHPFGSEGWIAVGLEETRLVQSDPRFTLESHRFHDYPRMEAARPVASGPRASFADLEGEAHLLRRRLLAKHLDSRRVRGLEGDFRAIMRARIAAFKRAGQGADAIALLADRIPTAVMSRVLGIPAEDGLGLIDASREAAGPVDPGYFDDLPVDDPRVEGSGLFATWMTSSAPEREAWTDEEVRYLATTLLTAGHMAPHALIGGILLLLANAPGLFAELRADRGLIPAAVEEFIRYLPVAVSTRPRIALEDVPIGNVTVRKDEVVLALVYPSSFDERAFTEPEHVDIRRQGEPHIRFGAGQHACPGRVLVRSELALFVEELVAAFGGIRPAAGTEVEDWRLQLCMTGPKELPLDWRD